MKAHKKTKLFRHFMTILNMLALAVPMVVLGFHALNDSLPKFFASQSVQHHGGESDVFSDDLDYANEQLKTRSLDDNLMLTMDSMNYMNYSVNMDNSYFTFDFETNDVNTFDDLVVNNIYHFSFDLSSYSNTLTNRYFFYSSAVFNFTYASTNQTTIFNYISSPTTYIRFCKLDSESFARIILNNLSIGFGFTNTIEFDALFIGGFSSIPNYMTITKCDITNIPITYHSSTINITSLDDWKIYYNNKNYVQIIDTGVSTHLPINVDFVSLFTQSDIINHDGNIATLLFINFYCNWILNISLIIFFPQVIMCFINWAIDLIYKFTEVKGD